MSEDQAFVWDRADGQPWESVQSLPPPIDAPSRTPSTLPWEQATYAGPYYEGTSGEDLRLDNEPQPWESLEPLPPPLHERESYERVQSEEEEEWQDTELIPRFATPPPAAIQSTIGGDVLPLYDMGYIDLSRRTIPILSSTGSPHPSYPTYPSHPIPPSRRRLGSLAIGPPRHLGVRRYTGYPRTPGHPPVIPLSTLVERLGISASVHDPRRRRRPCRQRSSLSPPPGIPLRGEFVVEEVMCEVGKDGLFGVEKGVAFPKTPEYLPPITKKSLRGRGRSGHGSGGVETSKRKRQGKAAGEYQDAWALDPRSDWCLTGLRGGHDNIYPTTWNGRGRIPNSINMDTVLRDMERSGQVRKQRRSKSEGGRRSGRAYVAGNGSHKGKKATVEDEESDREPEVRDGKDRSKVQFNEYDTAYTSGPEDYRKGQKEEERTEWTDVHDQVDTDGGRGRRRHQSVDGSEVDVYESAHYHPDEPRPFNLKRIHKNALETLGTHRKDKGKGKARASPVNPPEEDNPDDIHDASDPEPGNKPKKPDQYAAFKKTTGRHPKHFYANRHGEAVERFVLDRRPLGEGEEEPSGRRRKPMIDVVDVETGERTRRSIRGYGKLPKMIKVAAGVEGVDGRLPPRRRMGVEEVEEADGEGEGEERIPRRKSREGRRKKKGGCVVM